MVATHAPPCHPYPGWHPDLQSVASDEPTFSVDEFEGHSKHILQLFAPLADRYLPRTHGTHSLSAAPLYVPAPQGSV